MANNIRFDADAAAAIAELGKLADANESIGDAVEDTTRKNRQAAAEERRIANARDRLLRQAETAQERLQRRVDEFNRSIKGQQISEQQLGRVRDRLQADYLRDLERQQAELEDTTEELDGVGQSARRAFDPSVVTAFAGGFLSVQSLASGALDVVREIRQQARESAEELRRLAPGRGQLAQLSNGDPNRFQRLLELANQIRRQSGLEGDEAIDLAFELGSSGQEDAAAFFARLTVAERDTAGLARSTGQILQAFAGGDDVGSSRDLVSKAIAAASPAVGSGPAQIAEAVASVAASAQAFELRDEETFAAVSRIAQTTSASQAGTQFRSLLNSLARQGLADDLRGEGLTAVLRAVQVQVGDSEEELVKFLGSSEAAQAFSVLRDERALTQRLNQIDRASASGLADRLVQTALSDPRVRSSVESARAEQSRLLAGEFRGVSENRAETSADQQEAFDRLRGRGEIDIFFDRFADETRRLIFGPEAADGFGNSRLNQAIEEFREERPVATQGLSDSQVAERLIEEMRRSRVAVETLPERLNATNRPAFIPSR